MKVVIVAGGTNPGLMRPEYSDGSWEFWGINAIRPQWFADAGYRWARWFNIHRWEHLVRDWKEGLDAEVAWAKENPGIPFYTPGDWAPGDMPNEVSFPRVLLNAQYPRPDYHAGSFDWMVPFAHHLGATEIALHGVNLHNITGEPESARACLEYWIGVIEGMGTPVFIAGDCDLFWQYHIVRSRSVYGYDDVHMLEFKPTYTVMHDDAAQRGWTTPAAGSDVAGARWHEAWIRYWLQMDDHDRRTAAGEQNVPRPVAPHRT